MRKFIMNQDGSKTTPVRVQSSRNNSKTISMSIDNDCYPDDLKLKDVRKKNAPNDLK